MAIESVDTSYNGIPMSEMVLVPANGSEHPTISPEEEKSLVNDAAKSANGGKNVWTEGVKQALQYNPENLRDEVVPLDNLSMLSLVGVLQERHTYIVTRCILEEARIS